jgi:hypothetical protein
LINYFKDCPEKSSKCNKDKILECKGKNRNISNQCLYNDNFKEPEFDLFILESWLCKECVNGNIFYLNNSIGECK